MSTTTVAAFAVEWRKAVEEQEFLELEDLVESKRAELVLIVVELLHDPNQVVQTRTDATWWWWGDGSRDCPQSHPHAPPLLVSPSPQYEQQPF
ncbi:unnamed protein product [Clonostachys rosea f. rosea IK726]|uniref:Uncharacterized protein n=1 Tax=Clonostachys rosea f. rosea IK726 TaxID=1349383 RepID=A0ACA9TGZ7_BIOOC|nr:unnamed protein product [Clonostachys rosea f. rosea IK726]